MSAKSLVISSDLSRSLVFCLSLVIALNLTSCRCKHPKNLTDQYNNLKMELHPINLSGDGSITEATFTPSANSKSADLTQSKVKITFIDGGNGSQLIYPAADKENKAITSNGEESVANLSPTPELDSQGDPLKVPFTIMPGENISFMAIRFDLLDSEDQPVQTYTVNWQKTTANKPVDLSLTSSSVFPLKGKAPLELTLKNIGNHPLEPGKLKLQIIRSQGKEATILGSILSKDAICELAWEECSPVNDLGITKTLMVNPGTDKQATFILQLIYTEGDEQRLMGDPITVTWEAGAQVLLKDIQYDYDTGELMYSLVNEGTEPIKDVKLHYQCKSSEVKIADHLLNGLNEVLIGDLGVAEQRINQRLGFIDFCGNQQVEFDCWISYKGAPTELAKQTVSFTAAAIQLAITKLDYDPVNGHIIYNLQNVSEQTAHHVECRCINISEDEIGKAAVLPNEGEGIIRFTSIHGKSATGDQALPIDSGAASAAKFKFEVWYQGQSIATQELEVVACPVKLQLMPVRSTFLVGNNKAIEFDIKVASDSGPINKDKLRLLVTKHTANIAKLYYNQEEVIDSLPGSVLADNMVLTIEPGMALEASFDFQLTYNQAPVGEPQTFTWRAYTNQDTKTLFTAVEKSDTETIKQLVGTQGVQINATDDLGETPLWKAAATANEKLMLALLKFPAIQLNVTAGSNGPMASYTPLHLAVQQNNETLIKALLAKGADSNSQNDFGETPLHMAIRDNYQEAIAILLGDPKIAVNTPNNNGDTPLHIAIRSGHQEAIKLLLKHSSIQVNSQNVFGDTPLHCIVYQGDGNIGKLLVEKGADLTLKNNNGQTPEDLCRELYPEQ